MPVLLREFMRVEVFPCSLGPRHQEKVIRPKACRIRRDNNSINEHSKRNAPFVNRISKTRVFLVSPDKEMGQARSEKKKAEQCTRTDKCEEIAIVATSNAIVEPNTVVILRFNTIVTNAAMMGSRRAPDVAALAVLGWYLHCCIS